MTESSAPQVQHAEAVGTLPPRAPLLPRRAAGPRVRDRVRVPLDLLKATEAGLDDLDDYHPQVISGVAPPSSF